MSVCVSQFVVERSAILLVLVIKLTKETRRSDRLEGGGGAQRPGRSDVEPKKTGARSARARTQGKNPLVSI